MDKTLYVYRQGDVNLVECSGVPDTATPVARNDMDRIVVQPGIHKHYIASPGATLYADGDKRYLDVADDDSVKLEHAEHPMVALGKGTYEVRIGRTHTREGERAIAD